MSDPFERYKAYPASHFSRWRFWFHRLSVFCLVRPLARLFCPFEVFGKQNRPSKDVVRFIVAANHISLWDPPLVSCALRYPIAYMAKKELFQHPLAAEFFRIEGTFALDRESPDGKTLKTAFHVLRSPARWALGLFPEGTRSLDGNLLPLKKGVGALAYKTQTPVLPVGIRRDKLKGKAVVTIGPMITRLDDPDQIQSDVYDALIQLTQPAAEMI